MGGRLALLVILAQVAGLAAEDIQKWRTADGSLYFGDRPPAGSVKLGQ
jgi:hypothetical protein